MNKHPAIGKPKNGLVRQATNWLDSSSAAISSDSAFFGNRRSALDSVASDREQNFTSSLDGTTNRTADLARPNALSIRNGNLTIPQSGSNRLDLHFNRPAEILIAHHERQQRVVPDRAKGTESPYSRLQKATASRSTQAYFRRCSAEALRRVRALRATAIPKQNRIPPQQSAAQVQAKTIGVVAVIRVDEHNNAWRRFTRHDSFANRRHAGQARCTVTTLRFGNDGGSALRPLPSSRAIIGTIVDHKHMANRRQVTLRTMGSDCSSFKAGMMTSTDDRASTG